MNIEGDFWRDGAVCVRGAFSPRRDRAGAAGDRREPGRSLAVRQARQRRRRRCVHRGLLQLAADRRSSSSSSAHPMRRAIAAELIGGRTGPAVPRPRAGQGAGHPPAHAVAPGPAVLQRRRPAEREHVDPRRSGAARSRRSSSSKGSHRGPWYMPRTFLDGQAKWFPEGSLAELPDIDADPDRFPVIGWAARARRRRVLPHAHPARRRRRRAATNRRRVLSVRFLGDDMVHAVVPGRPRRRSPVSPTELADGAPLDHPLFPVVWERER